MYEVITPGLKEVQPSLEDAHDVYARAGFGSLCSRLGQYLVQWCAGSQLGSLTV